MVTLTPSFVQYFHLRRYIHTIIYMLTPPTPFTFYLTLAYYNTYTAVSIFKITIYTRPYHLHYHLHDDSFYSTIYTTSNAIIVLYYHSHQHEHYNLHQYEHPQLHLPVGFVSQSGGQDRRVAPLLHGLIHLGHVVHNKRDLSLTQAPAHMQTKRRALTKGNRETGCPRASYPLLGGPRDAQRLAHLPGSVRLRFVQLRLVVESARERRACGPSECHACVCVKVSVCVFAGVCAECVFECTQVCTMSVYVYE